MGRCVVGHDSSHVERLSERGPARSRPSGPIRRSNSSCAAAAAGLVSQTESRFAIATGSLLRRRRRGHLLSVPHCSNGYPELSELMRDADADSIKTRSIRLRSTMRTTLNIDDDLLIAIKEVARRESKSAGAVVSGLLRQSLSRGGEDSAQARREDPIDEFGFRPFPKRGGVVTNELIDRLREETGD